MPVVGARCKSVRRSHRPMSRSAVSVNLAQWALLCLQVKPWTMSALTRRHGRTCSLAAALTLRTNTSCQQHRAGNSRAQVVTASAPVWMLSHIRLVCHFQRHRPQAHGVAVANSCVRQQWRARGMPSIICKHLRHTLQQMACLGRLAAATACCQYVSSAACLGRFSQSPHSQARQASNCTLCLRWVHRRLRISVADAACG